MSPLWLMDYGSDANYVLHQYALIQWTALWNQAYLPDHNATDLLFLYVKKIRKFLCFQSFFVCFLLD